MAFNEKLPLSNPMPAAGRKRKLWWTVVPSVLLLAWFHRRSGEAIIEAWGVDSSSQNLALANSCKQVDPIFPTEKTDTLTAMDDFIASPKFVNDTVARMAGAIQVPSQSYDDLGPIGEDTRWDTMYDMAAYLEKTFPSIHNSLKLEKINTHGLLYTWEGSDSSLKPTVFMAHQDVVPVAESTIGQWTYPPFSGAYDGKYIWGRGAGDCKNTLIGIMEAVELLIDAGFKPKRTIVMSFGFDEEISGGQGARYLAAFLLERYGKDGASIIVDEGGGFTNLWGAIFAVPGIAEKGYVDVEIIVRMPGGHSSVPSDHTGIGVMSELITHIEASPYEPRLHSENPIIGVMQCGATYAPDFPSKLKKLLPSSKKQTYSKKKDKLADEAAKLGPQFKYLFTTSVAVDVIEGGVKVNALPERTRVLVNHRVNIGEHPSDVQAKMTKLAGKIADKYNLTLNAFTDEPEAPSSIILRVNDRVLEPAPVTPTDIASFTPYSVLSGTTRALYGVEAIMAPGLMTGNTDTKYYWDLTRYIFRYAPGWDHEDSSLDGIHTVDERVSVETHVKTVQWFSMFIRNMNEAELA
jgi:Gly-Xaa carboxypeptidase